MTATPSTKKKYRSNASYMKAEYTVELHTWQTRDLFFGAWEHGRYGLLQFAKTVYFLTQAFHKADPYAEYFLIETDDRLFKAQQFFETTKKELERQLQLVDEIQIRIYQGQNPMRRSLHFISPLGFVATRLLKNFDTILRIALTLKQLGIFLKPEQYDYQMLYKILRELFEFPSRWQQTNVTRKDILENTPLGKKAKAKMGELPEAILNQEIKAPFLKSHVAMLDQNKAPWE
jgi:integrating conjugative element protein (TIGR03761 family)